MSEITFPKNLRKEIKFYKNTGKLYDPEMLFSVEDNIENRKILTFKYQEEYPEKLYNFLTGRFITKNDANLKKLGFDKSEIRRPFGTKNEHDFSSNAINNFGSNFFKLCLGKGNVFISPLSLSLCFGMLSLGVTDGGNSIKYCTMEIR
jgi:hypothetical protein